MTREAQIKICSSCKHRKMNFQRGLLCGLTDEWADFEDTCPDFEKDEIAAVEVAQKSRANRMDFVETTNKPNNYWKYLGYFLLANLLLSVLRDVLFNIGSDNFFDKYITQFLLLETLFGAVVWIFIGWETNKLKHGIIASGVFALTGVLFQLVPLPDFFFFHYAPAILSAVYFGIMSFSDNQKRLKFILLTTVISIGLFAIQFFSTMLNLYKVESFLMDIFSFDVFTFFSYFYYYVQFIQDFFKDAFFFMAITFLYKYLNGEQKWGFHLVELGRKISNKKMALYTFVFYVGLFMFSFGIMGRVFNYYHWKDHLDWNGPRSLLLENIETIMCVGSSLVVIVFMVALYRKILLEYYLDHGKNISWNFYFGQMPVIGIFVWIYNLLTFKIATNIDPIKIESQANKWNSLRTFLMSIICLYVLVMIVLANNARGGIDLPSLTFVFIGVGIYALYLYKPNGVYIFTSVQFTAFLIVLVLNLMVKEIPQELVSKNVFWTMSMAFLLYPAFHLKMFTIELPSTPKETQEETDP